MDDNLAWTGVFPALTTPFYQNEAIDFDTLISKSKSQIAAGVHGLILGGSLGEAATLSSPEKMEMVRRVIEGTDQQVPVILNIAESSYAVAMEVMNNAREAGVAGFMLLPPMRYKADEREVTAWFEGLSNEAGRPVMVYNNPHDYGIGLNLNQITYLLDQCENITAIKESSRDVTQIYRLRQAFSGRLTLLCGVDTLFVESMLLGCQGWVAGLVNAFPAETMALYHHCVRGEWEQARVLYDWFLPLLELDIHPKLVQYIKLAESVTGLSTLHVRKPRLPLDAQEIEIVSNIIHRQLAMRPVV